MRPPAFPLVAPAATAAATTAASTSATTAATATMTATVAAATTTWTSTAVSTSITHRACFVHHQRAAQEVLAVAGLYCALGLSIVLDFEESKSSRLA